VDFPQLHVTQIVVNLLNFFIFSLALEITLLLCQELIGFIKNIHIQIKSICHKSNINK